MDPRVIKYRTRDGKGNDIVADVKVKQYEPIAATFNCPVCGKAQEAGIPVKKIVSSNFTDWNYLGEYVCSQCADLFSLYFYSYITDPDGIRLINVREIKEELIKEQKVPFRFIITTSKKKHLFYKSEVNYSNKRFCVNLEEERIYTTHRRMKDLFLFVESLLTLKATKDMLKRGELPYQVTIDHPWVVKELLRELQTSREIQIPLYCGQKLGSEEEALWNLDLIQKARSAGKRH